jgi:hypothetical protein
MMSASYLRMLAHERFINLLMNRRATGDKRDNDTLRKVAAREIINEERARGSTGSSPTTPSTGFENLFQRIWKIVQTMNHFADLDRNLKAEHSTFKSAEPTITDNPVIADEQFSQTREKLDPVVTFPVVTGNGRQSIPEAEFPNRFGAADEVTNSWRSSIELNNQIRAERERRSAQLRKPKYVG